MSQQVVATDQLQRAKRHWKIVAICALVALALTWMLGFVVVTGLVVRASVQQQRAEADRMEAEQVRRQAEERVTAIRAEARALAGANATSAGADFFGDKLSGEERNDNDLKMKFCWCPPGEFLMGSPQAELNREDNEGQVRVTITRGFWLGKFEVTQRQWEDVMDTTVDEQRALALENELRGSGPDYPMYFVNHSEATRFCDKLTLRERAAGRIDDGMEYCLPTESQWEYACRAGTTTATWPGEKLRSTQANFDGNHPYNSDAKGPFLGKTTVGGEFSGNAWGLCDMHGNVQEWCRDEYASELPGGIDPEVASEDKRRITRGGSWFDAGAYCRSAYRGRFNPNYRYDFLGFRVALIERIK
jgi:sulfatase modifying factor 1